MSERRKRGPVVRIPERVEKTKEKIRTLTETPGDGKPLIAVRGDRCFNSHGRRPLQRLSTPPLTLITPGTTLTPCKRSPLPWGSVYVECLIPTEGGREKGLEGGVWGNSAV